MKRCLPLLLLLLLLAGCTQKDKMNEAFETTTDRVEPQTALETVADAGEQEIRLLLDDEGVTVSANVKDNGSQADFPPKTTSAATANQTTAPSAPTTAKADKETQHTATTTTTKPAASQNNTTTTMPAASQKNTTTTAASGTPTTTSAPTTAASGTPTTTSAATLSTADAEKGRYELPAIPLG